MTQHIAPLTPLAPLVRVNGLREGICQGQVLCSRHSMRSPLAARRWSTHGHPVVSDPAPTAMARVGVQIGHHARVSKK